MHRLFHDDYSVTGNPGIEVTRESREGTRSIIDDVAPRVFLAERARFTAEACRANALNFSVERFREAFRQWVAETLRNSGKAA